ncbi:MAG: ABC transporter permease [Flavobacteriaceae bacterium]|nr:ABC transporter permease [Flavobacteriaceae bacterium]
MNFELFIAKRIIATKQYKSSVSSPIIKIAVLAIALGMIMMLVAVAAGVGLQEKIQEKVAAFNGHIIITKYDNNNSIASAKPIALHQDFYPEFKSVSGIKYVQAVANKAGVIRTENDFEGINLKGVGADYNWRYFKEYLISGKLPNVNEGKENPELLISEYLANRLGFKLGSTVTTHFFKEDVTKLPNTRKFKVVGIYNSGFQDFDKTIMIADIRHIQRMNKWGKDAGGKYNEVGGFEVFLDNFSELELKEKEVYQDTDSFLNVSTIKDKYYGIFEWIKMFDFNIYVIIGVMILISVINMSVMLLVLILEKTKLIGILKALGGNNWSIRKIFLYNASYIVLIGLFWGNLIGLGLLFLQKYCKLFPLDPNNYYVTEVPVYINMWYIVALNVGTFVLCFVLLLIPTQIITKISPVKAIRFE